MIPVSVPSCVLTAMAIADAPVATAVGKRFGQCVGML